MTTNTAALPYLLGVRKQMTLAERIAWCERMAVQAGSLVDCDRYLAEAAGLRGEGINDLAVVPHCRIAYQLGVEDGRTLRSLLEFRVVEQSSCQR